MTRSDNNQIHGGTVTIRILDHTDRAEVELLAQLDSSRAPEGAMIGIEVEGRLLAATSLTSGETVANPFSQTSELRSLLEVRSAQLRHRAQRRANRLTPRLPRRSSDHGPAGPARASAATGW